MNFGVLFKAFDTVMALREVAKRITVNPAPPPAGDSGLVHNSGGGIAGHIEARLTNVVVAALKEAFDRDHARLELERAQIEEQRRRAEEAMRQELRRQAADRELARLRLLAGMALIGWIASVGVFVARLGSATTNSRIAMALGWLLLLSAMATAFTAQGRAGRDIVGGGDGSAAAGAGSIAIWLLTGGLALAAISLMF